MPCQSSARPPSAVAGFAGLPEIPTDQLAAFARLATPHIGRLDLEFSRRLKKERDYDTLKIKALLQITPGAAAVLVAAGQPLANFFEQAGYHSRRLAKLNVSPADLQQALREYDELLDPMLANSHPERAERLRPVRERLHFGLVLTINSAYYEIREAETQAFYGLLRAEIEATGLDDLLRRFIAILTRTFHAQAGRLIPLPEPAGIATRLLKRLAMPHYIRAGSCDEELILDAVMRGRHQSYWSIPFFSQGRLAGLVQFGFATPYRWLPRELELLNGFAERCLRAAERERLVQELSAQREQVRALAGHLMQAEEEERRRVSRELHDEAGQSLLFLRLHLEMLEKVAPPDLTSKLSDARRVAERVIVEIRRIIAALGPSVLEQLGLAPAIRHLSNRFRKLYPIHLRVRMLAGGGRLPAETEAVIYRIVQECYQNIVKHSQATNVNLLLRTADESLELKVEDDGVGFDVEQALARPDSFGLKGMRERIALMGGRFAIHGGPGRGTAISVGLPIPRSHSTSDPGVQRDHGKHSSASNRRSHPVPAGDQDAAVR